MERRDKINYYLDIAEAVTGRGCWLLRLIEKGMVWAWLFLI